MLTLSESPVRNTRPIPDREYVPVSSSSSSTKQYNGVLRNEPEQFQFISTSHDMDAAGDGELASDLASLLPPGSPLAPTPAPIVPLWEKITTNKYDVVLLSLFIQMLYGMSIITFDSDGYFFLPVIVYIITKLVWFPVQSTSNIANALLLLNGLSQASVHNFLYLMQCFSVVTCDTFVYLFTTICIQSLWITVCDLLAT